MAEICGWYAQAQVYMKDYQSARSLAKRGIELSKTIGERRFVAFNESMLALVIEKEEGEAEAVAQWERSLALALEIGEHVALATRARRHLAALALATGDYGRATALFEENLALSREAGNPIGHCWAVAGLAELARIQGDYLQAQALCTEGLAISRDTGDRYATSRLLSIQGNIAQAKGEHEQAISFYRDSLSLAVTLEASDIAERCLLGLAHEAFTVGDFLQATRLFAAAARLLTITRQLAPADRNAYEKTLYDLRTHLNPTTFTNAWAAGEVMSPKQVFSSLYIQSHMDVSSTIRGKPRTSSYPDGLTEREVEVLRLVAQGWTDAQIAEELVISTRTVNAHLTSIYRKISVSSRHAATQYALSRHLA